MCCMFGGCSNPSKTSDLLVTSTIGGADVVNGLVILNESKLTSSVSSADDSVLTMTFENGDVLTFNMGLQVYPVNLSYSVSYVSNEEITSEFAVEMIKVLLDSDGVEKYLTDENIEVIESTITSKVSTIFTLNMMNEIDTSIEVNYDGKCLNISISAKEGK